MIAYWIRNYLSSETLLCTQKLLNDKHIVRVSSFFFQTFSGNSRSNPWVKHAIVGLPTARSIRFQPINYSIHRALRVEVYGIKTPAGTTSCQVGASAMLSLS